MRTATFLMLLACVSQLAPAALPEGDTPVTLDAAEMSRIWQEVQTGASPRALPTSGWQEAMLEPDAETARVMLLVWLQRANPQLEIGAHAREYAGAVALHRQALAGMPAACAALAAAYRSGQLGIFALPQSEAKARWFEQRALSAENLPE